MKQIFEVSSLFQLANIYAGLKSGAIDQASTHGHYAYEPEGAGPEERILLVCDNRIINDFGDPFVASDIAAELLEPFDRVIDYNDAIWPNHPSTWRPRNDDLRPIQHMLRSLWELGDSQLQLYVESIQSAPATTITAIFAESDVFVHGDGLMNYGPTRNVLPSSLAQRLCGLIVADLVEGLSPLLLAEYNVPVTYIRPAALRQTFDTMSRADSCRQLESFCTPENSTLIIGQYLADIGLVDPSTELAIYQEMLRTAIDSGAQQVYFKPHPASTESITPSLVSIAEATGVAVRVLPPDLPVELCVHQLQPELVIACFSTAMATAHRLYGSRVRAMSTDLALEYFTPYENSNRIPVTICDYLFGEGPPEPGTGDGVTIQTLVDAVSYCMQPKNNAHLRAAAEKLLAANFDEYRRYFKRRRLTKLDLPGKLDPPQVREISPVRRVVRRGRRLAARTGQRFAPRTVSLLRSAKRRAR